MDAQGWLAGAHSLASSNCDVRPAGEAIRHNVIHNISLPPGEFGGPEVEQLFTNRLDPAAHPYYATLQGLRAWHAGASNWRGRERCNDFPIGIELEGTDELPFTDAQYGELGRLMERPKDAYPIEDLVGHSDIAPGRKTDPGPCFDWGRLEKLLSDQER